ncbi:MAG: DegT/DnrJ/EryC1/StrS family aminotransferase, partial [Chlamydiota bacterium]|nr:DegT/DnrJ/EryC1/StrS family aminotransferase [Chlamydiota bacterium]
MKIPFFDIKRQVYTLEKEFNAVFQDFQQSGGYILGSVVEDFEKNISTYTHTVHSIGVASGSDALWLSLLAMDVGPGDEVITTPYTFIATASAISKTGATPV